MEYLRSAFYIVFVLSVLVVAHEWGHYIAAKLCRMRVEDFSLFFGKRLVCLGVRNGTEYNIRSIPLGGFVKIAGMEPDDISNGAPVFGRKRPGGRASAATLRGLDESKLEDVRFENVSERIIQAVEAAVGSDCLLTPEGKADLNALLSGAGLNEDEHRYLEAVVGAAAYRPDPEGFNQKPRWQRALVIAAGPFLSLLTGYAIIVVMGFTTGLPYTNRYEPQIAAIVAGKPAAQNGVRAGDTVVAIDGAPIRSGNEMVDKIHGSAGRPLRLSLLRAGTTFTVTVTPEPGQYQEMVNHRLVSKTVGMIGIVPRVIEIWKRLTPGESVREGGRILVFDVSSMLQGIFSKHVRENISGPIFIGKIIHDNGKDGPRSVMLTAAMLSLSLGVINLFPIPILDGGHLMLILWEAVRRRRLSSREVYAAQMVGLSIIGVLFVLVMYNDIMRFIPGGPKP